jgi:hypothetical protein
MRLQPDNPNAGAGNVSVAVDGPQSGVLIMGSPQAGAFVATEVLILADTLDNEEAIRAWLGEHGIHVAVAWSDTASAKDGAPQAVGGQPRWASPQRPRRPGRGDPSA